ncbi:MAG: hypothetical protein ACREA0_26855, partial [bacterium]
MRNFHAIEGKQALPAVPRREFLIGLASLGAVAVLPKTLLAAQARAPASAQPFRIDTHHHYSSPAFIEEIVRRNTGQRPLMEWT